MNISKEHLETTTKKMASILSSKGYGKLFFVPNAGYLVAKELEKYLSFKTVFTPEKSDCLVDDIIDSGKTLLKYTPYKKPFLALYATGKSFYSKYAVENLNTKEWVYIFSEEDDVRENIRRLLEYIGENPDREGLKDTPTRVIKSYSEIFSGYKQNPKEIFKAIFNEKYDEMVISKNIEFYSMCEHHMLPFFGKIHIGYIPNKKVLGISKLSRLVEIYSRRLQIQERLVEQIADELNSSLKPKGVIVVAEAVHMCMVMRGVKKQNSKMITSAIRGAFKKQPAREEFLNLIKKEE